MATHALLLLFVVSQVAAQEPGREGFMHHLSNGMKFAQDMLGTESVAMKVAEFVVRAFQRNSPPPRRPYEDNLKEEDDLLLGENRPQHDMKEAPSPLAPLKHLVKLFGLQPSQISAVAVNALVFVAQMISTFLTGPKRPARPYRTDDPASWILNKNSRSLQDLITTAKNESLPDVIDNLIREQGEDETNCIRLLVCKITPYVYKMQKVVFGEGERGNSDEKLRGSAILYGNLPTAEEIDSRSGMCERKHKDCDLDE